MTRRLARHLGPCAVVGFLTSACAGASSDIQEHAEKIASLRATAAATIDAWLTGDVSGIFARTALEQTFVLVDQERAAAAATPEALADPAASVVAAEGEQLQRALATLSDAVRRQDGSSARQQLAVVLRQASGHP